MTSWHGKTVLTPEDIADGLCLKSKDGSHCVHWWDGDGKPCCSCGDNPPAMDPETGLSLDT